MSILVTGCADARWAALSAASPGVRALPMRPGDVGRTFADLAKARDLLGYRPSTEFMEGMKTFASWYETDGRHQDGVA